MESGSSCWNQGLCSFKTKGATRWPMIGDRWVSSKDTLGVTEKNKSTRIAVPGAFRGSGLVWRFFDYLFGFQKHPFLTPSTWAGSHFLWQKPSPVGAIPIFFLDQWANRSEWAAADFAEEYSTTLLVLKGEVVDYVNTLYEYDGEEYVWPFVEELRHESGISCCRRWQAVYFDHLGWRFLSVVVVFSVDFSSFGHLEGQFLWLIK